MSCTELTQRTPHVPSTGSVGSNVVPPSYPSSVNAVARIEMSCIALMQRTPHVPGACFIGSTVMPPSYPRSFTLSFAPR